jgi:RimJ/RimL family protein N-acetyltransferase
MKSESADQKLLASLIKSFVTPAPDKQVFMIEDKSGGQEIGICGLFEIDTMTKVALVKFLPIRQKLGMGDHYVDAMSTISAHAFGTLGLERLFINVPADNLFITSVLIRCGAQKIEPEYTFKAQDSGPFDSYVVRKVDWESNGH